MHIDYQSAKASHLNVGLPPSPGAASHGSASKSQVATFILPEVIAVAGVVGAVAEICKSIKSIFSDADCPNQANLIFQQAENQIHATINQFKALIANCATQAELAAVERQVEQLLGAVSSPAVCQRFALTLRETLCRAEQRLIRQLAATQQHAREAAIAGLKAQLQQNQQDHTDALAREDDGAAKRLAESIGRGQAQMGAICREFDIAAGSARTAVEAIQLRESALKEERQELEQLTGLSGTLMVDEFNRRASSTSKTSERRSNGGSVLSKPKVPGAGVRP